MVFFAGLPSDNKRSWWQIGKLGAGEVVKKDSIQPLTGCLVNKENMEKFENQKTQAQAKGGKFQPVIFDLSSSSTSRTSKLTTSHIACRVLHGFTRTETRASPY
jgi:hypothetical protein